MKYVTADLKRPIPIGRRGENGATIVQFPVHVFFPDIEDATYHLTHTREGDDEPYMCATEMVGENLEWLIQRADLARPGAGSLQLTAIPNIDSELFSKSVILVTQTGPSLGQDGDTPEAYLAWIDSLAQYAARAENGASVAVEAKDAALAAQAAAQGAAQEALNDARDATQQASYAGAARQAAEMAQHFSQEAQGKAEDAQSAAEAAQSAAETAQSAAEAAAGSASSDAGSAAGSAEAAAASAAEAAASAGTAGYMWFSIDQRGHLIYQKNSYAQADFYLLDGHLYVGERA